MFFCWLEILTLHQSAAYIKGRAHLIGYCEVTEGFSGSLAKKFAVFLFLLTLSHVTSSKSYFWKRHTYVVADVFDTFFKNDICRRWRLTRYCPIWPIWCSAHGWTSCLANSSRILVCSLDFNQLSCWPRFKWSMNLLLQHLPYHRTLLEATFLSFDYINYSHTADKTIYATFCFVVDDYYFWLLFLFYNCLLNMLWWCQK